MKKKSLISLSSLLLASALLVGCGNKSTNKQVENKEEVPVTEPEDDTNEDTSSGSNTNDVVKYTVTINLKGATLIESAQEKTSFLTRSGTLWSVLKNKAPAITDIEIPDPTYIKSISYTYDEAGNEPITDATPVRNDTDLYLQIEHDEPTESYCTVKWLNDGGDTLYPNEKYRSGEIPFYKGVTPNSSQHGDDYIFDGWLPAIRPIESGDIGKSIPFSAQYEQIGVDCTVTYDYNYKNEEGGEIVDYRYVKQGGHAQPLDPAPVRKNYIFGGWYEEEGCQNPFKFDETIINDDSTRIFAKWIPELEQLKIDPNGGTFNDDTKVIKTFNSTYGKTWADVKTEHTDIAIKTAPEGFKLDGYKYQYYDVINACWSDLSDGFEITKSLSIKVSYEPLVTTLKFTDEYQAATMPADTEIKCGTKWIEIKNDCLPTNVQSGFAFDHYYTMVGDVKTVINDTYVFNFPADTASITLHAVYKVTVNFSNDSTKGRIDYASAEFKTGDKWGDVKAKYLPTVIDPTVWTFKNYTTNETPSATVDDNYIIKKPLTFTANYEGATASSFANDSWEVFTSYLSGKTFADISTTGAYKDEFDGNGGSFVDLTRTVEVQGKTYTVRVIDEAKEGSSTLAHSNLLTFEFTNVLDLEVPYSLNAEDNCYKNSFINNYLNKSFIHELPKALQDSIKNTPVKYFDTTVPAEERTVKTDNEKLFILSASELNFATYPDYTGMPVKDEGSYAYYAQINEDKKKTLLNSETPVNYWTRSADASGITEASWNVNPDGTLGYFEEGEYYSMPVNSGGVYIAPAFEL